MSETHVRRRRARKTWECQAEPWAHDTRISPGDVYCEVTVFHATGSRDIAIVRYCDYCGKTEYPEYEELCRGYGTVQGQLLLDFTDNDE